MCFKLNNNIIIVSKKIMIVFLFFMFSPIKYMNIFLFLFNTINGDFMNLIDVMSKKIIVCFVTDGVVKISSIMKDNDIGFVPIVDGNKVVGVITDRDIVTKIVSNNDIDADITNYMTKDIISVPSSSSISDALDMMRKYKIKRLLVTDDDKVIGIVSISDILFCDVDDKLLNSIKEIFEVGPNIHKYETEIDEFYL